MAVLEEWSPIRRSRALVDRTRLTDPLARFIYGPSGQLQVEQADGAFLPIQ
jgi:hypothetical protein